MKNSFKKFALFVLVLSMAIFLYFQNYAYANIDYMHIYIDQAKGNNSYETDGSEVTPFKSITYAMLVMKNLNITKPLFLHIKAGVYNSDPSKKANEREIFPIEITNSIVMKGEDNAKECIISGSYNSDSKSALIRGQNLTNIFIQNLTLKEMERIDSASNGGALELINCSGTIENCIISNNKSTLGGGLWIETSDNLQFNILNNQFKSNQSSISGGGFYVIGDYIGEIKGNSFISNSIYSKDKAKGGGFHIEGSCLANISNNTFYSNIIKTEEDHACGAGFYISNQIGKISNNLFINNSTEYVHHKSQFGGGFYIFDTITGSIEKNTFIGNYSQYGGGFCLYGKIIGTISSNLFSINTAEKRGACFYIVGSYDNSAVISNNYFINNDIVEYKNSGTAFYSNQNFEAVNNTFLGNSINNDESFVYIPDSAKYSIIKNNIFDSIHTAIWEKGEFDLIVHNNNFHNMTNILNRNNNPLGFDSFFIEMLLKNFKNNYEWNPELLFETYTVGKWTEEPEYNYENNETVLTDSIQNWKESQFKGAFLDLSNSIFLIIKNNSQTKIVVNGNLSATIYAGLSTEYQIIDYRLSPNSKNIDNGTIGSNVDFQDNVRPWGMGYDIGAHEFVNPMAPSVLTNSNAINVSLTSAILIANVNPNGLSTICYFDYGFDTDYGYTTVSSRQYTGNELISIENTLFGLSPDTFYFYRLVAINQIGTTYGKTAQFKTKKNTASIKGSVQISIAGYNDLSVKKAAVYLENTNLSTTTDDNGDFILDDIQANSYKLIIKASDLVTFEKDIFLKQGEVLDFESIDMKVPSSIVFDQEMEKAVNDALLKWDIKHDRKKGLPEAIDSLKVISGLEN